jgi:putative sigma-54 modulation protein
VELRITGRHDSMADDVKAYVEEKLAPLGRFNRHARSLEVVFDEAHLVKLVEIIAHVDHGAPVVVNAKHEDARAAVDIAHDKLEKALRRHKERTEDRRRGKGDPGAAARFAGEDASEASDESPTK